LDENIAPPSVFFAPIITPTTSEAEALEDRRNIAMEDAPITPRKKLIAPLIMGTPIRHKIEEDMTEEDHRIQRRRRNLWRELSKKEGNWNVMGDNPTPKAATPDSMPYVKPTNFATTMREASEKRWKGAGLQVIPEGSNPFETYVPDPMVPEMQLRPESQPECSQVERSPAGEVICLFHGNVSSSGMISIAQCKLPIGGPAIH
jgi:hypothetical protein